MTTAETAYLVTTLGGEKPLALVTEVELVGSIPGYGYIRKIGSHVCPCRNEDVFTTKTAAKATAADRLRQLLSSINAEYDRVIGELESHA
jgi:hypothetical protein